MEWQTVYGSQPESPAEIEITPTAVYMRRNITQTDTGWEYEEAKLTPEEYQTLKSAVYTDLKERIETLDQANADILIGQAEIQEAQSNQDDVLADILLTQMEDDNEQTV